MSDATRQTSRLRLTSRLETDVPDRREHPDENFLTSPWAWRPALSYSHGWVRFLQRHLVDAYAGICAAA
jgi:hypothetical protein